MVGCAWWVVLGGVGCCYSLCGGVSRPRGPPPLFVGVSSFFFNAFGIGRVGLLSQK